MTSQKLNEEHEILRRFMAVVVSSAFWDSLKMVFLRPGIAIRAAIYRSAPGTRALSGPGAPGALL